MRSIQIEKNNQKNLVGMTPEDSENRFFFFFFFFLALSLTSWVTGKFAHWINNYGKMNVEHEW